VLEGYDVYLQELSYREQSSSFCRNSWQMSRAIPM